MINVFASGIWLHEILFSHLNDVYYFLSAGALDSIVICIMLRISSRLSIPLSIIALTSALTNLLGLYLWWSYYEPVTYNALMLAIYCASIYILADGRHGVARIYRKCINFGGSRIKSFLFHSRTDIKK